MRLTAEGPESGIDKKSIVSRMQAMANGARWGLQQHRTLVLVIGCNALVAVTGFVKDLALAMYLGTTAVADAFAATYFAIDTVGNTVTAGAVGVGSTAALARLAATGTAGVYRLTACMLAGLCGFGALGMAAVLLLFRDTFAPALGGARAEHLLVLHLYLVFLPLVVFYPVYTAFSGALQGVGRYTASVLAPACLNVAVVLTALRLIGKTHQGTGALWLAVAISAGSAAMAMLVGLVWQWWGRQAAVWSFHAACVHWPTIQRAGRTAGGYIVYLALVQVVGIVERYLALSLAPGSVAALSYAYRFAQFPIWVVVSGVVTLLLPQLSSALGKSDDKRAGQLLSDACLFCTAVCLPVTVILELLGWPILHVLFERGAFTTHSVTLTYAFLVGYAFAIPLQALALTLYRAIAATGQMSAAIRVAFVATAVNIAFDWGWALWLGPIALGLGQALGNAISCGWLWRYVRRALSVPAGIRTKPLVGLFAGNGMACIACLAADGVLQMVCNRSGWWTQAAMLGLALVVVATVYIGSLIRFHVLPARGGVLGENVDCDSRLQ